MPPESVIGWGMMAGSIPLCVLWLAQVRRVQQRLDAADRRADAADRRADELEQRLQYLRRYLDAIELNRGTKDDWLE
jgi:hypothetical protein